MQRLTSSLHPTCIIDQVKALVLHVRITKLHCYCKHSVLYKVRARAQIG